MFAVAVFVVVVGSGSARRGACWVRLAWRGETTAAAAFAAVAEPAARIAACDPASEVAWSRTDQDDCVEK